MNMNKTLRESTFIMPRGVMKMLRGAPKYFLALKGVLKVLDILKGGGGLQTFQSFGPAGAWSVLSHPSNIVNRIDGWETH
jgi:hypothetical protein